MLLLYDSRFLTARKEFCTPSSFLPAVFRANSLLKSTLRIWAPDCHSMSPEGHVAQRDITTHTQHNTVLTDISTVTVLSHTGNGYHTTKNPLLCETSVQEADTFYLASFQHLAPQHLLLPSTMLEPRTSSHDPFRKVVSQQQLEPHPQSCLGSGTTQHT